MKQLLYVLTAICNRISVILTGNYCSCEIILWWIGPSAFPHLRATAKCAPVHSEKKIQKLSLGLCLFKRYTFVPKGCIL